MQTRTNPKVWCVQEIVNPDNKWETIGKIMLISYMRKEEFPHLEFFISDEFKHLRGKGIMSKVVPKYLKDCKKWGDNRLLAVVKEDNIASQKILDANSFVRISKIDDKYCYMTDLNFSREKINKMVSLIKRNFPD
jgi:RimJ/RimL family protein N-acetyltransferase